MYTCVIIKTPVMLSYMTLTEFGLLFSEIDLQSFIYHFVHGHPEFTVIKVRHRNCQLFACANRAQSDFMVGLYCQKYQWVPKIRK